MVWNANEKKCECDTQNGYYNYNGTCKKADCSLSGGNLPIIGGIFDPVQRELCLDEENKSFTCCHEYEPCNRKTHKCECASERQCGIYCCSSSEECVKFYKNGVEDTYQERCQQKCGDKEKRCYTYLNGNTYQSSWCCPENKSRCGSKPGECEYDGGKSCKENETVYKKKNGNYECCPASQVVCTNSQGIGICCDEGFTHCSEDGSKCGKCPEGTFYDLVDKVCKCPGNTGWNSDTNECEMCEGRLYFNGKNQPTCRSQRECVMKPINNPLDRGNYAYDTQGGKCCLEEEVACFTRNVFWNGYTYICCPEGASSCSQRLEYNKDLKVNEIVTLCDNDVISRERPNTQVNSKEDE